MTTWMEDDYLYILIENNTMISYPPWDIEEFLYKCTGNCDLAYAPDHIISFLERYPVVPTYIDAGYEYGRYDEVHGNWSGMIGHVIYLLRKWFAFCTYKFSRYLRTKQI